MLDYSGMRSKNADLKVGRTQKEIARSVGIGESRYSKLIKGVCDPTPMEINKMCKGFSCDVGDLVKYVKLDGEFDED